MISTKFLNNHVDTNSYAYFEFVYKYLHITRTNELYQEKKKKYIAGVFRRLVWKPSRQVERHTIKENLI